MELDMLRAVVTTVSFGVFLGIVTWAYSGANRARFDQAAQLPFADDEHAPGSGHE